MPTTLMMRMSNRSLGSFWTRKLFETSFQKFAKHARDIEQKLSLLESMKDVYAQLVVQKTKDNLPYKNVLLTAMVSRQRGPSHSYIFQTINGSRYLLSKAITWGIHGDLIRDNIWGGLPRKH
jgi:hypothetical protein